MNSISAGAVFGVKKGRGAEGKPIVFEILERHG